MICKSQKVTYETKADAIADRNQMAAQRKSFRACRPYQCQICGYWHLTRMSKKVQRAIYEWPKLPSQSSNLVVFANYNKPESWIIAKNRRKYERSKFLGQIPKD